MNALIAYLTKTRPLPPFLITCAKRASDLRRAKWQRLGMLLLAAICTITSSGASAAQAEPNALEWPSLHLKLVTQGFLQPVDVVSANDGTGRLFVLERRGLVYIIQDGQRLEPSFLNIFDRVAFCGECGLLSIAFPPDFAEEGYFFVSYISNEDIAPPDTGDLDTDADTVIVRMRVTDDPNRASNKEERILTINQPASNHNGGHMIFGPDGYLYLGMGDGGDQNDAFNNGQDPASLHSKILRIEVGATGTYTVPADNPFINVEGYREEIWASGLRNPWRFHFDEPTGDFYLADVGESNIEEINYLAAAEIGKGGQNYGWSIAEGNGCFPLSGAQDCDRTGLTMPVVTYTHEIGDCSVIGGGVYRSPRPEQAPLYLYGDFCTGRIWGMQRDGAAWVTQELLDNDFLISSFGEDEFGNVYVIDYAGAIYRILDFSHAEYMPSLYASAQSQSAQSQSAQSQPE